jgi:predicted anti-sigma-YlaC factor YlaD
VCNLATGGGIQEDKGKPMSCQEVTEFLADYFGGQLPLRQRIVFRLHLLMCRDCRRYLDSYAATIRLTRALGAKSSADDLAPVPEELVRAILAARNSQSQ